MGVSARLKQLKLYTTEAISAALEPTAGKGHWFFEIAGTDQEECARCGLKVRLHGARKTRRVPECPLFTVEKIMES